MSVVYCLTAIGAASVLIAGLQRRRDRHDVFDILPRAMAVLTILASVVLGPISGAWPVAAGLCLLVLSMACYAAWGWSKAVRFFQPAAGLFALGSLLVIFGAASGTGVRLGLGAAVVLVLFVQALLAGRRYSRAGHSAALTGHLASVVLAGAALIQAWPSNTWDLPMATAALVVIYAAMSYLRAGDGFRLGTLLWGSFVALSCLAARARGPYWQQAPLMAVLSLAWVTAGYALQRLKAVSWPRSLYTAATVLALFCGTVSLFTPAVDDSWRVFLINGLVFASLFLILRHDVLAYLLTLSLSLMAYDWVKASTSLFTQDVLFYLVIGAGVLAVTFLLPYARKILGRMGTVPVFSIFTWRGAALLSVVVVGAAILLLSAYSLKITGHPKFCLSCHNMSNYYESWQHSSHKNVACIQCHYEPGVASTVKGKLAGLVQVVKYVSHSYTNKPHAMISNKSCMRQGCHSDMDRSKETPLFGSMIRFSHEVHLREHPRGKELNCVSCHGQTVEGRHIAVTKTTCLTCHFYKRKDKPVAVGQCLTCHQVPAKTVTFMGQAFNHTEFLKGKPAVRCTHCHSQVTQGQGAVSDARCRGCHTGKQAKPTDQAKFHLVHVSKGHFDCLQCHDEIRHGVRPMTRQLMAAGNCQTCHSGQRHSVQENIYAGTGIPGMANMPDAMYKAGVACDGCHTEVRVAGLGTTMLFTRKIFGAKQCTACHGSRRYGRMLADWQADTKDRIDNLKPMIEKLDRACKTAKAPAEELANVRKRLAAARADLATIKADGSYGAHNYPYVSAALDGVETQVDKCQLLVAGWKQASEEGP